MQPRPTTMSWLKLAKEQEILYVSEVLKVREVEGEAETKPKEKRFLGMIQEEHQVAARGVYLNFIFLVFLASLQQGFCSVCIKEGFVEGRYIH